jgi:tRNA-splicing ligase RtcB
MDGLCFMHTKKCMEIRLKDLNRLGYKDNIARSLAITIISKYCKHESKEQIEFTLKDMLENPDTYKENEIWQTGRTSVSHSGREAFYSLQSAQ